MAGPISGPFLGTSPTFLGQTSTSHWFSKLLISEGEWTSLISINTKPTNADSCSFLANEPMGVKELEEAIPEETMEECSTGKKRSRKIRQETPVVESAVKHSDVRSSCNGFKMNVCKAKNCLGCSSDPLFLHHL